MADPLSVASAIVGLLAAAGKVVEILGPYISAARDTPKIARSVHSEVVQSRIILSALHGLLDNLSVVSRSRTLLVPINDLITVFTNGVLIFNELEESVLKISQSGGDRLVTRMQWVRKEGSFTEFIIRLQAFKDTTLLLLNILQCDSDRRAAQNHDDLSGKLTKLLENTNLLSRLETLEDSFDALSLVEAKKPIPSQISVSCPSDHQSDLDDQSFYSVETTKPSLENLKVESNPNSSESTLTVPTFEFQAALDASVAYRRARVGTIGFSTRRSVAASNTWSVFSGVSLSEISDLSRVAIPVFPADISNSHRYEFMKPTSTKLYTARRPTAATMGKWAQSVKRVPILRELRFDIQFQVPVIFVCQPTNYRGPIKGVEVMYIDGTPKSLDITWSALPSVLNSPSVKEQQRAAKALIRAPDNELATWVSLLSALQRMENESRCWQEHVWERRAEQKVLPRTTQLPEKFDTDSILDCAIGEHTLAFAIQRRSTTWTALPSHFKKPYATTTWCHAIELAAALGIYWKDFDRSRDMYRAQGNGYLIKSSIVPDLGTVLTFQVHGRSRFEQFRVIPQDEIKELCFGLVPTIFRSGDTQRLPLLSSNTTPTTEILHLANLDEIAQSLAVIGCNTWVTKLVSEDKIGSHIFPGMVAKSLHIKYSVFRMLPNPTPYKWEAGASSLALMMQSFSHHCNESVMHNATAKAQTFIQREIQQRAQAILECGSQITKGSTDVDLIDLLHESVADATELLTTYSMRERKHMHREYTTKSKLIGSITAGVTAKPTESVNVKEETAEEILQRRRKALTLLTLRIHIQVVLAGLQEGTSATRLDIGNIEDSAESFAWKELERIPPELNKQSLSRFTSGSLDLRSSLRLRNWPALWISLPLLGMPNLAKANSARQRQLRMILRKHSSGR